MTAGVLGEATVRELEIGLAGSVVGPWDPDYDASPSSLEPRDRQTAGADRTSGVDRGCGASRPVCPK